MFTYGIGYIGQGASYVMMSTYLVLFLTNCVGLSSSLAATISSLALLMEVVAGMLVGNISDGFRSKWGRRRPFMFIAGVAMLPILSLFMHKIGDENTKTFVFVIYYLAFAMLFRVFFSTFEIPNQALGAEITRDYDERTKLRTMCRYFSITGNGIGYILPLTFFSLYGNESPRGWQIIGILFGIITSTSWIVSAVLNKVGNPEEESSPDGSEPKSGEKRNPISDIVYNYGELLKLYPVKLMIGYKAWFTCAYGLYNVATIYYLTYAAGFPSNISRYMYYITISIFLVMTPLVNKMTLKLGKANQQMLVMLACGIVGILIFLIGKGTIWGTAIYLAAFAVMQTSFWQVSYALFNDVVEVDEWVYHKRRAGDVSSIISVLGTLISAIVIEFFGIAFDIAGFDSELEVQGAGTVEFLNVAFILIPSLFLIINVVTLKIFPINKQTFSDLTKGLEARRMGESYEEYMPGINKILGIKGKKYASETDV